MKITSAKTRLSAVLLTLCMAALLVSVPAFAAGVNYIDKIKVTYAHIDYKAGESPRVTAKVTEGNCTVKYEYWRELYQKEEGGLWYGTGRYWYSDPSKMESLSADKRITKFEAGHSYSYNIVLTADKGCYIGDEETVVTVGDHEWGTPARSTNLEIKNTSTQLNVYSIYALDIPEDKTDKVITSVSIINVNKNLSASAPVTFTAKSQHGAADGYDITEEAWEAGSSLNDMIKSTDAPRAPVAGGEYWYSIVLTAKDGYVFSSDFSDSNHRIKEGSGVTFTLGGVMYEGRFNVSNNGKTLTAWEFMDPVTAKKDGSVIEDAPNYKITEGVNSAWTKNTDGTLTFRANGDFSKFSGIKIDGSTVPADKYTAVSGSTVITLKANYLSSISVGKHRLTVVYTDGECSTEFEIKAAQNGNTRQNETKSPKTGDSTLPVQWAVPLLIGCVLVSAVSAGKSKAFKN